MSYINTLLLYLFLFYFFFHRTQFLQFFHLAIVSNVYFDAKPYKKVNFPLRKLYRGVIMLVDPVKQSYNFQTHFRAFYILNFPYQVYCTRKCYFFTGFYHRAFIVHVSYIPRRVYTFSISNPSEVFTFRY